MARTKAVITITEWATHVHGRVASSNTILSTFDRVTAYDSAHSIWIYFTDIVAGDGSMIGSEGFISVSVHLVQWLASLLLLFTRLFGNGRAYQCGEKRAWTSRPAQDTACMHQSWQCHSAGLSVLLAFTDTGLICRLSPIRLFNETRYG